MNMSSEHRNLTWALMLPFLAGVHPNTWAVEYQGQHVCAVKGSSVVILCSFYHPHSLGVKRVMWGHVRPRHLSGRVVFDSSVRKGATRFQYVGDKHHSCALKIHEVTPNDAGKYIITFNNYKTDAWRSNAGPTLTVVNLKILATKTNGKETMKEGDSVNLTCMNGCDGHDLPSAFSWFKNGKPIHEGRVLSLNNISSANSGNYTCSLKTQTATTSGGLNIDVEYGPKNTSVSVSPSMETEVVSNLTLTCSSHSNPPVENYTWFKIDDDDVVEVGHQPVFFPADQGLYLCSVANKHGTQNSSAVSLNIKSHQAAFASDVLITVSVALLLIVTMVIAVRRSFNNKSMWAPKTGCEMDTENTGYSNWPVFGKSQSEAENRCEGPTPEIIYATVDFNTRGTSNMQQQMDSCKDAHSVIYSTVYSFRGRVSSPSYTEQL